MAKSYSPRPSSRPEFSTTAAAAPGVGVADRAVAAADGADDARGALGRLATGHRPVAVRLVRPGPGGRGGQVLGEVLGRARLIGAVDRGDRQVGEGHAGVVGGDRRVVPGGDLLVEDPGEDLGGEVEVLDALEVVDDRDRRDVVRQLEDLATGAALLRGGQLLLVQRGVGAGEVGAAGDELLAATAGAHRVVVHRHARLHARVAGGPALHRGLLAAGACAGEAAAQFLGAAGGAGGAATGVLLVRGAARGEREGADERSREDDSARRGAELQGRALRRCARAFYRAAWNQRGPTLG